MTEEQRAARNARKRERRKENLEAARAATSRQMRRWRAANPEKAKAAVLRRSRSETAMAYRNEWRRRNIERVNEKARNRLRSLMADPERAEARREAARAWRARRPDKVILHKARERIAAITGQRLSDIPQELAEAKAMHLMLRRALRELAEEPSAT